MRFLFIIMLLPLIIGCSSMGTEKSIRKEVLDLTTKYASDKFKEPRMSVSADGVVTIEESYINYIIPGLYTPKIVIDPSKMVTGLINDDEIEDAVISIIGYDGQGMETPENLIFINSEGKLSLSRSIESNMKILSITDRIITAEVSTRSLNSPLRDCHVCKEVVKYRFKSGDLVRVE